MNSLQKKIYEIFLAVKKICDEHGIPYYAIGGTCLGAVRHKGFIPWDDDLDIAIPGHYYEKFYKIAKRELPNNLIIKYMPDSEKNVNLFIKVYDTKTTFIERFERQYPKEYKGVYIDIMPLYGIPKNSKKFLMYSLQVTICIFMNELLRLPYEDVSRFLRLRAKILWIVTRPINKIIIKKYGCRFWSDLWKSIVSKYDFEKSTYIGYTWSKIRDERIFPKKWFESTVLLPFEDTYIRCPLEWDKYLRCSFGNYMQLPPESERMTHSNDAIVDLDKPFSFYQDKYFKSKRRK